MTGSINPSSRQPTVFNPNWVAIGRRPPASNQLALKMQTRSSTMASSSASIQNRRPLKDAVQGLTSATLGRAHHRNKPKLVGLDGGSLPPAIRLRCSRVTQKTLDQYQMAIARFEQWCKHPCGRLSHSSLDGKVVRFLTFLHEVEDAETEARGLLNLWAPIDAVPDCLNISTCPIPRKHLAAGGSFVQGLCNCLFQKRSSTMSSWKLDEPSPTFSSWVWSSLIAALGQVRPYSYAEIMWCRLLVLATIVGQSLWNSVKWAKEPRLEQLMTPSLWGDIPDRRWMNKVMKFLYDRSTGKLFPEDHTGQLWTSTGRCMQGPQLLCSDCVASHFAAQLSFQRCLLQASWP